MMSNTARQGSPILGRLAAGPISWGVCEVPGWGLQLSPDRVLSEMRSLGILATEAGPDGYLGRDPAPVRALLDRYGLELVGGFLPVVLHDPARLSTSLAAARRAAKMLGELGASVLCSGVVLDDEWSTSRMLSTEEWDHLLGALPLLDGIAGQYGLVHALHPHWGTLVEREPEVMRVVRESEVALCLDTGHLTLGGTDPATLAAEASERIVHAHLKDVDTAVAERLRAGELSLVQAVQAGLFRPLGDGDARVRDTVLGLEGAGYRGWYVLEQDVALAAEPAEGTGPVEDAGRSIEFLRTFERDGVKAAAAAEGRWPEGSETTRPDDSRSTRGRGLRMSEHETIEGGGVNRRDLLVRGGVLTAGAALFGGPAAAAYGSRQRHGAIEAAKTKVAVVTHGDTGSFWSVFKKGVDQAHSDLGSRGVSVSQVYANNDVSKQVAGINAGIAAKANVIVTSVPDASALKDPLTNASKKGIEIITCNSGLGAFDALPTYDCHVGQTEDVAGEGAGKQFNAAGAKNLVVVIHEASNSGLTQRAAGAKKTFKGTTKTLVIPNATSDLPGTQQKIAAYFKANPRTDAFLGLNPDVTTTALNAVKKGTKVGTFDLSPGVISAVESGKILFAIDQQQYLQGYLPVVFAYLFVNNLNTVGNGAPVLTGPGIVNKGNAARVAALAKKGTR